MRKILLTLAFLTVFYLNASQAQYLKDLTLNEKSNTVTNLEDGVSMLSSTPPTAANITLGVHGGAAFVKDNTGLTVGLFAEVGFGGFSFVPQANYWKAEDRTNFELCGLARIKLSNDRKLEPYIDGGIGINFYDNKKENITKVGLDLGGGIRLYDVGSNYNLIFDGKYKIIVSDAQPDGNISGYFLTAGIEFKF